MRFNYNNNEVQLTKKAKINYLGRHTGASPEVIFVLRMELGRSDLPSFINFNHLFMRPKNDECSCTCQACAAIKQAHQNNSINELFMAYDSQEISEMLWNWFVFAICSPEFQDWDPNQRSNLAYFYRLITGVMQQLQIINSKIN